MDADAQLATPWGSAKLTTKTWAIGAQALRIPVLMTKTETGGLGPWEARAEPAANAGWAKGEAE
eukprot:7453671-Pyramimonas_sp.AAC.1